MTNTVSELNIEPKPVQKCCLEDKGRRVVKVAFSICTALSLLIGTLLLFNVKTIPKYTSLNKAGKQILESVIEIQLEEENYLLYNQEDAFDNVKDEINELRKLVSSYEKSMPAEKEAKLFDFAAWDEAISLYERLFDQFNLYHKAVEKHIIELRTLEKSILAIIFSKMNPERGIIALQEIRIHEKGYFLYRNYPKTPDKRSFQDKRKEAVSNLLMWAQHDKRIEELMEKDDKLFKTILNCYKSQDAIFPALKKEGGKIRNVAEKFFEEGNQKLYLISHRCVFLSTTLLLMWLIMAIAIAVTRFR
jgi:hypothetical protein